ncbi:hypothetical protein Daus18300_003445 [Diaporthe australafricana]|uniref:Forkhead domain-containing protein n=1 Tax=Diaporthe australafricana TaxID=127596 RepID=A0ABR3XGX4_9PEZI
MTSSHSQDGPGLNHSTPTPQPQAQSQSQSRSQPQPTDGQPTPSRSPSANDRPSDHQTPSHTNHVPNNKAPSPSRTPAHAARTSIPNDKGVPSHASAEISDSHSEATRNWVENQQPPSQSEQTGTLEDGILPPRPAEAVVPFGQGALLEDFPIDHTRLLGLSESAMPLGLSQDLSAGLDLSAVSTFPMAGDEMAVPWILAPGNISYPAGVSGVSVLENDDDAASLDDPVIDETHFDRKARLEFPDSFVALTTNTAIIGRDNLVYKRALKDKKRAEGGYYPAPGVPEKRGYYSKSYVSQEGGALGPESDGEGNPRPAKRRKTASSDQHTHPPQQEEAAANDSSAQDNVISSRQYVDHTPGAVPVDVEALRPSYDDILFVGIHGAGPDIIETSRGISRKHLKIQYDEETRTWNATAIGRNGFFCEEELYSKDEVVILRSGDILQIQAVVFLFTITGVENGKYGNEDARIYSEGGKEMSFDFQSSRAEEDMKDTSDALSSEEETATAGVMVDSDDDDDEDDEAGEADETTGQDPAANDGVDKAESVEPIRLTIESDPVKGTSQSAEPDAAQAMVPPKKRGPGRPPKNGVMSKREERELKKKREEEDKKNNPPQEPGEPPIKRKVGRPRKHPRPEDEGDQPEKRKYKPRKPKNEDGEDDEDPDGDKADKQKRLQKPKTPPLDLGKKEDWPEEKLQKPNKNYQTLIDEVLTNAAPDGLTLKQIYKRIATLYPFFCFCVDTKGWESSVRHNLIGSDCFQKNNETHLWKRVPGIPLESGKKRKPSDTAAEPRPPPIYNNFSHAHGYQQPTHPQHYPAQQMVPPGGAPQMNGMPRYQPSGQAHSAPIPNSTQFTLPPNERAVVRQDMLQQRQQQPQLQQTQPPTTMPPNTMPMPQPHNYVATAASPRSQYPSTQQQPYNPAFSQRPQQAPLLHAPAPGSHPAQNHAQQSLIARPVQGAIPVTQRGPVVAQTGPVQQNQRTPNLPHPPQPASNSVQAAALGPAVEPALREHIRKFSSEVVKQLQGRVSRPHAVAVSVITRGLGLTDTSLTPENENFEKAISNIFHTHKLSYSRPKATAASSAATVASRPPSAAATPTVNGNGAAAAAGSTPVKPAPIHATPISAPNGGAAAAAIQVNGSLTATSSASNGIVGGALPGSARAESSTPGPTSAGPTAPAPTAAGTVHTSAAASSGNTSGPSTGLPSTSTPGPARSSATPTPSTPVPDSTDVQLLDPKLVEVIQQYKTLSQQVLAPKVGQLQAEILVMSAVNRVLGFTDDTIIPRTTQSTKLGLREAEDALISSLRPRIDMYIRERQAPSTAPATSTPPPVPAPTSMPLPLPAPSR